MAFEIFGRREREGVTILDLEGRLVLGEAASLLRNELRDAPGRGVLRIALDLAKLDYIDSTGLGVLVMAATTLQKADGGLKLFSLNKRNIELMIITKLTTVFEIYNDENDAVNSFFPDRKINRFDILSFVKGQKSE